MKNSSWSVCGARLVRRHALCPFIGVPAVWSQLTRILFRRSTIRLILVLGRADFAASTLQGRMRPASETRGVEGFSAVAAANSVQSGAWKSLPEPVTLPRRLQATPSLAASKLLLNGHTNLDSLTHPAAPHSLSALSPSSALVLTCNSEIRR